ncbi:MAG: PD-(D/E)XK nuclease family protein [Desulfobacterales bacterium]
MNLIGVIDALTEDKNGIVAVDHKTAKSIKQQADVDNDLQFSVYAWLLTSNKYAGSCALSAGASGTEFELLAP